AMQRPDVSVVSNPEFLREGSAVHDFMNPDRIVIGTEDRSAAMRVSSLFMGVSAPLIITDPASAETIKYAANSFLATKISFVNAIAAVCEAVGADVNDVVLGMGSDPRIGDRFLQPGPGWGGSCFPKDTRALVRIAEDAGYDFDLLKGVIEVNSEQFERIAHKVAARAGGSLDGVTVAVLGLTFKANTDDLRDSPALEVASRLQARGAVLRAFDPAVHSPVNGIDVYDSAYTAAEDAAVAVLLTEWDEFRWLDWEKMAQQMQTARLVDARNLLDPATMRRRGFEYEGLGRA
ncbi:MAG: nucleotide sugar dehydrogenase, partial [Actinomycetota bacterium]|nr:nucleotide sugar dehydrogenase [Actinomycetota bacterium]